MVKCIMVLFQSETGSVCLPCCDCEMHCFMLFKVCLLNDAMAPSGGLKPEVPFKIGFGLNVLT